MRGFVVVCQSSYFSMSMHDIWYCVLWHVTAEPETHLWQQTDFCNTTMRPRCRIAPILKRNVVITHTAFPNEQMKRSPEGIDSLEVA